MLEPGSPLAGQEEEKERREGQGGGGKGGWKPWPCFPRRNLSGARAACAQPGLCGALQGQG